MTNEMIVEELIMLVVKAFAAYRIAVTFVYDHGPLHVFWHLRMFFDDRAPAVDDHDSFWKTASLKDRIWKSACELMSCPFCFGAWASLAIFVLPDWMVYWFAVWGIQSLLQQLARVMNRMRKELR